MIYDHELVLFRQGLFRVEIEGQEYFCPADSFIIIPPGRWHTTWNTLDKTGQRNWSHFDWVYAGPYGATPVMTFHPAKPVLRLTRPAPDFVPQAVFHGPIPAPHRAYALFDRLYHLRLLGEEHDKATCRAVLLELLIELLDAREQARAPKEQQSRLAYQVRERLRKVAEEEAGASIQAALAELRFSYAHLCRIFRAEYGLPPLRYVHAIRIGRAKQLLCDTRLNISEIAFKAGFRDLPYFSQLFRKTTGQTPTAYRDGLHSG